jgi:uncharacterized protein
MAVALFGATGRTGSELLATCRQRGWPVRALVRQPGRLPEADGLRVAIGDARDPQAVQALVRGAGAVLCTLGMADISMPATDFSAAVATVVEAMRVEKVRRLVMVGSVGVLDHPDGGYRHQHEAPDWLRHVSAEHQRNLETLRAAGSAWGLDWTLMCPANLVDDLPPGRSYRAFDALPAQAAGSNETGIADLARAMADLLTDRSALRRRVGILSVR